MSWFKRMPRQELVYRENIELGSKVKHLEERLKNAEERLEWWAAAKNIEVTNWKERGDRYASFNTGLEEKFISLQNTLAEVLKNPEILQILKNKEKK